MKVVLFAPNKGSHERFVLLASSLREQGHEPHVVRKFSMDSRSVAVECERQDFILVGVSGNEEECLLGLDILSHVAENRRGKALGTCMDSHGYATVFKHLRYPSQNDIRFAVFVGERNAFPNGSNLHSVGGRRHIIPPSEFNRDRVRTLAQDLVEVGQKKILSM